MAAESNKISLDIVTPSGLMMSTTVDQLTASGVLGEFGILPGHLPLLSALKPGPVVFTRQGEPFRFQAGAGFAEVGPDHVILLVDSFEKGEIFSLRAQLEWKASFEVDVLKNALNRADNRLRTLEAENEQSSDEYVVLTGLVNKGKERLEKR